MKIGIVGWGIEGQSAMRYFGPDHEYLIVNEHPKDDFPSTSDKVKVQHLSTDKPHGVTSSAHDLSYLEGIEDCDKIIYSVTSYHNLKEKFGDSKEFWNKTTSVMKIFFEETPTRNLIGVTGSKGKGTTSTLIHLMLKEAGFSSYLTGNIGESVLDTLPKLKADDWVVIEMSSFQLFHFNYSPHIAVCVKITEEHQDWHANMEEYIDTKANIFRHQSEDDIAIYFSDNQYCRDIVGTSPGKKIAYFAHPGAYLKENTSIVVGENETEVVKKSEIKLLGDHNLENVCAALTAFWQISQDKEAAHKVLSGFTGLEHRLEMVRELHGVKYYDDSFGTTPDTAILALKAIKSPKVLIVGGVDKGIPFEGLADEIAKARVKHVIAIGKTTPKIIGLLKERGFDKVTEGLTSMNEIVKKAQNEAEAGDAVVLAPAGSSYDMFFDYKDRGEQFKAAVQELA
jgi:UDP-N-acetylmuramoylalanine--D-glutamate ligase